MIDMSSNEFIRWKYIFSHMYVHTYGCGESELYSISEAQKEYGWVALM